MNKIFLTYANGCLRKQLVARDMEPVLRVYKPYNEPYENLPPGF
jgi:hypothetical protein